jgi:antitoxin PrlF
MRTILTNEGQVTIPQAILEAKELKPGSELTVVLNDLGEIVVRKEAAERAAPADRFDEVPGTADIKWRTDELMTLLRGDE